MIVPMKKAAVIVQAKDADHAVYKMRSLGIMHVEYSRTPAGQDISILKEDLQKVAAAINILENPVYKKTDAVEPLEPPDWKFVAGHLVDQEKRLEQLNAYSSVLSAQIQEWEYWGDFDPQDIARLQGKGVYLRFVQIPLSAAKDIPGNTAAYEIFRRAGSAHYIIISQGEVELPFKELTLPKMGLEAMRVRSREDRRLKDQIIDDIDKNRVYLPALIALELKLKKQLEFHEALEGMGRQDSIAYLTGYIPVDQVEKLEKAGRKEQWGLSIRDVTDEDAPPVLLRNPRWIRIIEPVMKLLGVMPGYKELDVSLVFIVFFSIFFGILIGDAGYGLLYLLLTLWFQKKKGVQLKNKDIFYLLYVLSSSAIIWGALTAAFFGQDWLLARGVKPLVPALNDPAVMQKSCFFLGALHLSIAHAWRGFLKFPTLSFLADAGWIAVLWVSFFLAGSLILGEPFPAYGLPAALAGIALVLFFSEPRRNVFKRLGAGFMSVTFGLSFMSAFTDVVSYVRLFAVGIAGVAISNTTNTIAASVSTGLAGVGAGVVITIIGHALNVVLGPIGILVHGVRLNVLEFGVNHSGVTWDGNPYKPLQESL